jgi:hypothetical protein
MSRYSVLAASGDMPCLLTERAPAQQGEPRLGANGFAGIGRENDSTGLYLQNRAPCVMAGAGRSPVSPCAPVQRVHVVLGWFCSCRYAIVSRYATLERGWWVSPGYPGNDRVSQVGEGGLTKVGFKIGVEQPVQIVRGDVLEGHGVVETAGYRSTTSTSRTL